MKRILICAIAAALLALCACDDPPAPAMSKACVVSDATAKAQADAAKKQGELQIAIEERVAAIQTATLTKCVESGGSPIMMNGNIDCRPAPKKPEKQK